MIAALAGSARADEVSLGVGFGGGANLGGDLDAAFSGDGEVGGRFTFGWRRASTQVEASFFGTDMHLARSAMTGSHSTLSLGVGLKQYVAIVPHVELYARAALDHTWLVPFPDQSMPPMGFSGPGIGYGAGVELGWRWLVLWIDAGRQHLRLESDDAKPLTGTVDQVNVGVSFTTAY